MNTKTLHALKASIAHWERLASGDRIPFEDVGTSYCELCRMFYSKRDPDTYKRCYGCPVSEKSGEITCDNTPYDDASCIAATDGLDSKLFREAAAKELEFLKSLLP